jgi:hypothetical protein
MPDRYYGKGEITMILPTGLEIWDTDKIRCADCNHWEYLSRIASGKAIKHSSRCDTPKLQLAAPAQVKSADGSMEALKAEALKTKGNGMTAEALLKAVDLGYLTVSEAMNTDY